MTTVDLNDRVVVVGAATWLEPDSDRLTAWAERHVRQDPDIGWMLGAYVEADNYNSNGHLFPQAELESYAVHTITGKPLNMLHHERYIVGHFAGASMVYPEGVTSDAAGEPLTDSYETAAGLERPMVDALAAVYRRFFPDEARLIARAHKDGTLFYSMEAHPQSLTCPTDRAGCGQTYPFKGIVHESYCAHLNASRISPKRLNMAHFNAGAVIIPPVQPGWSQAQIRELAEKIAADPDGTESLYAAIEDASPHLGPREWETVMGQIVLHAKSY